MSLDLYLECRSCNRYVEEFNYTYNVSCMWYAVWPADAKHDTWLPGAHMVNIDGMSGKDSLPVLDRAISALGADPVKFKAMNPENGWGSYRGFLKFLKDLRAAANEHQSAVWRSWR